MIKLYSLISKLFHNLVTIQLCNFIYFRKISVPAASIYLPLSHWLKYYHLLLIYCFYIIGGLNDYSFFLTKLYANLQDSSDSFHATVYIPCQSIKIRCVFLKIPAYPIIIPGLPLRTTFWRRLHNMSSLMNL